MRQLSKKVNKESRTNFWQVEQNWLHMEESARNQVQVSTKLGQLTKLQNQQAAKDLELKKKADKKAAKRAELEANKKKGK